MKIRFLLSGLFVVLIFIIAIALILKNEDGGLFDKSTSNNSNGGNAKNHRVSPVDIPPPSFTKGNLIDGAEKGEFGGPTSSQEKELLTEVIECARRNIDTAKKMAEQIKKEGREVESHHGRRWTTLRDSQQNTVVTTTIVYKGSTDEIAEIRRDFEDEEGDGTADYSVLFDENGDPTLYRSRSGRTSVQFYPDGTIKELKVSPETHRILMVHWDRDGKETAMEAIDLPRGKGILEEIPPPSPESTQSQWLKRLGVNIDDTVVDDHANDEKPLKSNLDQIGN